GPDVEQAINFAASRGLSVLIQPPRPSAATWTDNLATLQPDLHLVWSHSMLLSPEVLQVPRLGSVNVHGGLLPEYRGGHVMQWAMINGQQETGVTLHHIDEHLDTGPIIAQRRFPIAPDDDARSLRQKLRQTGASLLSEWLPAILAGNAPRIAQDETRARY